MVASDSEVPTTGGVKRTLVVTMRIALQLSRWSLNFQHLYSRSIIDVDDSTYHVGVIYIYVRRHLSIRHVVVAIVLPLVHTS